MGKQMESSQALSFLLILISVPLMLYVGLIIGYSYNVVPLSVMERLGLVSISSSHGKFSATRAQLYNLKTALVNYCSDVGRYPHTGSVISSTTLILADKYCLYDNFSRNVLVNPRVGHPFISNGVTPETYLKRWKGPYMDYAPEEFMRDAWGKKIKFELNWENASGSSTPTDDRASLYLHAASADGTFDLLDEVIVASYTGDDIIVRVARTKIKRV